MVPGYFGVAEVELGELVLCSYVPHDLIYITRPQTVKLGQAYRDSSSSKPVWAVQGRTFKPLGGVDNLDRVGGGGHAKVAQGSSHEISRPSLSCR